MLPDMPLRWHINKIHGQHAAHGLSSGCMAVYCNALAHPQCVPHGKGRGWNYP
jgi:hypothetical protein